MKALAILALLALGGCAVATTAVDVGVGAATTAVDVSTTVAGGAVRTVTGSHHDDKNEN